MRHRILRSRGYAIEQLHTKMTRTHPVFGVDFPVDSNQYGAIKSFLNESDIKDELTDNSAKTPTFRPSHPCDHVKTRMIIPDGKIVTAHGVSGSYTYDLSFEGNLPGYATYLFGLPPSATEDLAAYVASLSTYGEEHEEPFIDWEALENDFLDISQNILQKEVLLGETVAQPQLVIDAVRFLISPARGIQRFVKYAVKHYNSRALRSSVGKVADRVLKDAANSTLMYNFAVKPMISDLAGIEKAHRVIRNQLDFLRKNRDQYVPVRVRQVAATDGFPLIKPDGSPPDPLPTSSHHPGMAEIFTSPPELLKLASMGADFRVRPDLTLEANFNAYAQYFGIGQIVGLLWELVPFSFVVDWVSNVGERIQKFSQIHTYNPYCDSRGFCCSVKRVEHKPVRVSSGVIPLYGGTIPEEISGVEIASIQTSRYTRFLTIPESRSVFDVSHFGLSQVINGTSLLIQKLIKLR